MDTQTLPLVTILLLMAGNELLKAKSPTQNTQTAQQSWAKYNDTNRKIPSKTSKSFTSASIINSSLQPPPPPQPWKNLG